MQVFCIMSTAFYLLILLVIIKQYRKVKLHREYYDSMEEIYCCEPSLRNLDKVNRNVVIDRYSLAHVITVVIGGILALIPGLIYHFTRYYLRSEGEILLGTEWQRIFGVYMTSFWLFVYTLNCCYGFSRRGSLQILSFLLFRKFPEQTFEKSRALKKHLRNVGILFAILFPLYMSGIFSYAYLDGNVVVAKSVWNFSGEYYILKECKSVEMTYRKISVKAVPKYIQAEIYIKNSDGTVLALGIDEIFGSSLGCTEDQQHLIVDILRGNGVKMIKPQLSKEEVLAILDYNGETFLQFYYPELCEQYGFSPK